MKRRAERRGREGHTTISGLEGVWGVALRSANERASGGDVEWRLDCPITLQGVELAVDLGWTDFIKGLYPTGKYLPWSLLQWEDRSRNPIPSLYLLSSVLKVIIRALECRNRNMSGR